jgi:hypothetical protein
VVPSLDVLKNAIARLAGTGTYVSASDVTPELKVLNVDGKRPTDPDYPLHIKSIADSQSKRGPG